MDAIDTEIRGLPLPSLCLSASLLVSEFKIPKYFSGKITTLAETTSVFEIRSYFEKHTTETNI